MERNIYKIGKELFITSDEDIIKDTKICWCIDISCNKLVLCQGVLPSYHYKHYKKIIMTTDKLINVLCGCGKNCGAKESGVQPIPDEFLEWFVKNPSCEEVDVEKTYVTNSGLGYREYAVLDSNFKVIEINANISQTSYYLGKITALYPYEYDINYKIIIPIEESKQEITIEEIEQQITLTEARGERVIKYLDKYKGQSIYNEIALAIEFGYQLKLEEDE